MNEVIHPDNAAAVPWVTSDSRGRVPDTSMLPGGEKAPPAAVGLPKDAVQGAHDTLDGLADSAAPALRRVGESVAVAGDTLHAKSGQLREKRDEWVEGMRTTVRGQPLVAVAAAFALGVVISGIVRIVR